MMESGSAMTSASSLMGTFHWGPWICGRSDRLSDPSCNPPRPREIHPLCGLKFCVQGVLVTVVSWPWCCMEFCV